MNRRTWLKQTAAALAAPAAFGAPPSPPATRIIDCHVHFYDPARPGGVPWPGKGTKLYRTVLPRDWLAVASPHGVRETVVVEASPLLEDNQWILDLAAKEKSVVGFAGNLDLIDPEFAEHVKRFAGNPIFRGIRARGGLAKFGEARDQIVQSAKVLALHGLELDLNGPSSMLPAAAEIAKAVPELRIVINHLGGSGDPREINTGWKDNIRLVAARRNVFMKVSALVEQVKCGWGAAPRDAGYYLPVLDHLWENFGADRLIYGSNWPVSDKGAPYDVVFRIVSEYFSGKGREACEKYFWKNSLAAYQWRERTS
ncbi:MAG: amidohydrolase family protein [Verrucomicrobiaceae bacterium]|nr:amidohydrolase family protein [Verrucomicrobiaceae bacterium]